MHFSKLIDDYRNSQILQEPDKIVYKLYQMSSELVQ